MMRCSKSLNISSLDSVQIYLDITDPALNCKFKALYITGWEVIGILPSDGKSLAQMLGLWTWFPKGTNYSSPLCLQRKENHTTTLKNLDQQHAWRGKSRHCQTKGAEGRDPHPFIILPHSPIRQVLEANFELQVTKQSVCQSKMLFRVEMLSVHPSRGACGH